MLKKSIFGIMIIIIIGFCFFVIACDDGNSPCIHTFGNWTQTLAATCTTSGSQERICSKCDEKETGTISALGHIWIDNWQLSSATCILPECEVRICNREGCTETETRNETNPALGHDDGVWHTTSEANCTENGIRELRCTRCEAVLETDSATLTPLGHDWSEWIEINVATFISPKEEERTCTRCDEKETRFVGHPLPMIITTTQGWNDILSLLNGRTGDYIININDNIPIEGSTANSFGTTATGSSLTVTLQGNGTLSLISQGNMIRLGDNQTLIIDSTELILQGLTDGQNGATQDNNTSLVYLDGSNTKLELLNGTIKGNIIRSDTASAYGGGVYVKDGTFVMNDGYISNNTASSSTSSYYYDYSGSLGGGVYVKNGTFTMNGGIISGNTSLYSGSSTSSTTNSYGGGVYVEDGTFTMNGGTISDNTASSSGIHKGSRGGGVFFAGEGIFTMKGNASIHSNKSFSSDGYSDGGGVRGEGTGTFIMQDNASIYNNIASSYFQSRGGGVAFWGILTMQGTSSIYNNTSSDYNSYYRSNSYGGGVYIGMGGTLTMKDNASVSNNIATAAASEGGGVHIDYGTFIMQGDVSVSDNIVTGSSNQYGSRGGGVQIFGGTFTMQDNSSVTGNTVTSISNYSYGGGISLYYNSEDWPNTFTMNGGKISGNISSSDGGGVHVEEGCTFTLNNGTISGNSSSGNGGGMYNNGLFRIVNGTIFGLNESTTSLRNTASGIGAALYNEGASQSGTFNGTDGMWNSSGILSNTNNTVIVVNGVLQ